MLSRKKERQTIDFDICKRNLLLKLSKENDKSKKGSVDAPIVDLVEYINQTNDYCTTSSCSGRFAVFCASYDETKQEQVSKGGKWLFVEHRTISPEELIEAVLKEVVYCKGVTLFKLEPFVLHVQCRNSDKAQELLNLAIAAGFRESGILLGRRVMLGIRTTSDSMEFPIAENGKLLVTEEYLRYVIEYGNRKLEDNMHRIAVFFESIRNAFQIGDNQESSKKVHTATFLMVLRIHSSAPGKVILLGEHAVVYNREALCGVVDSCRIHCYVENCSKQSIYISVMESASESEERIEIDYHNPISVNMESRNVLDIFKNEIAKYAVYNAIPCHFTLSVVVIVLFFLQELNLSIFIISITCSGSLCNNGLSIRLENHGIPKEKGLGGSAALCVSVAAALLGYTHPSSFASSAACAKYLSSDFLSRVNELAFKGEVFFHGTPSGIDNTVSCYGGIVRFCRQVNGSIVTRPVEAKPFSVLLVDSMLPKNTARMIQRVRELHDVFPDSVDHMFDCIDGLVKTVSGGHSLFALEQDKLELATKVNQGILKALGVSCEAIDTIVRTAEHHGFAAKLTGGGGGGCVFAIQRNASDAEENQLIASLHALGFETHKIQLGGDGVKIECINSVV